jgi:cytochrome b561
MVLHWLVAAGIAFLYIHGFLMMRIEEAKRLGELNFHRSIGITVFALVLVRVWWRMLRPPTPAPMPEVQSRIAELVHLLIYALLIVNGFAGTVGWIASGDPVDFFGMSLLAPHAPSLRLNHACVLVGQATARILLAVIALHVLAVIKHEWFDNDRLLDRMIPGPAILLPLHPREILRKIRERRQKQHEQQSSAQESGASVTRE